MAILANMTPYGTCGVCGFICGIIYLAIICKIKKLSFDDYIYVYVWAAIGAIIGAKILYLILELPNIAKAVALSQINQEYIMSLIGGGFVFYGGLIGSMISVCVASKFFGLEANETFQVITPAMPLAHAFGRLGCSIVGCCYGIEIKNGLGIVYNHSEFAPLGVKLFPVQLIEAAGDILIFIFLVFPVLKEKKKNRILEIYLILYTFLRFTLEFFRGDKVRGKFLIFSTSQWISLIILIVVAVVIIKQKEKEQIVK